MSTKYIFHGAQRFVGNIRFVRNALRLEGFFLRFQKPTQPARNGSSETLSVCVRLEGFLGSVKLTQGSCEVRLKNIAVLL